jgi:hypothetical protein
MLSAASWKMVALLSSFDFVSFVSSWPGRSTRHAGFEVSQFLPVTGDGCVDGV